VNADYSGCKDEQTSADVYDVSSFGLPKDSGPGGAGGACTSAIIRSLSKYLYSCTHAQHACARGRILAQHAQRSGVGNLQVILKQCNYYPSMNFQPTIQTKHGFNCWNLCVRFSRKKSEFLYAYMHTYARARALTQARTHARTHARERTHTHTHTRIRAMHLRMHMGAGPKSIFSH
jgi:hypothetical protein